MSGIDDRGNIVLPSGEAYNPQVAVQNVLNNMYGQSQGIPYIPMNQFTPTSSYGVNRFLGGDVNIPLTFDVNTPAYMPEYTPFIYTPGSWQEHLAADQTTNENPSSAQAGSGEFRMSPNSQD